MSFKIKHPILFVWWDWGAQISSCPQYMDGRNWWKTRGWRSSFLSPKLNQPCTPRHLSLPRHSVLALKSDNMRRFHVVKMSFYAQERIFRSYFIYIYTHTSLNLFNLNKPNSSLGFNVQLTSIIILYVILATLGSTFRRLWLNLDPFTNLFEH